VSIPSKRYPEDFVQSSSKALSIQEWLCNLIFPIKESSLESLCLLSQLPRFLVHQRSNLLNFIFNHPSFSYPFVQGSCELVIYAYFLVPVVENGNNSIDEAILGHNLEVQRILLNQNTHTSELPQSRTTNVGARPEHSLSTSDWLLSFEGGPGGSLYPILVS
jgi:hypothetical protein